MAGKSPAQTYARLFGAVLLAGGVIGFFVNSSFAADGLGEPLLLFDVNGWHNLVHVASGALGLAVAGNYASARGYALWFGLVYLLVAFLGFITFGGDGTDSILKLVPVNTEDNLLHLLIGLAGLAAAQATPRAPAPTTA